MGVRYEPQAIRLSVADVVAKRCVESCAVERIRDGCGEGMSLEVRCDVDEGHLLLFFFSP